MFLGLLCALEIREEKLLHEPKDIAKSQDYKVLERLFEELTKCKEDDQQREFSLDIHFVSRHRVNFQECFLPLGTVHLLLDYLGFFLYKYLVDCYFGFLVLHSHLKNARISN